MKSIKRPVSLLLLALLTACASSGAPISGSAHAPASAADASAPVARTPVDTARLPRVELTPDLLFGVLASEIAAQRGQAGSAALTDLALARQTRDPRLAERATLFALAAGNGQAAQDALSLWLQIDPESFPAREEQLVIALREGRLVDSQPLIQSVLAGKPDLAPDLFEQIARLMPLQPDKQAAYRATRTLTAGYPDLPQAHFALYSAAAEAGDLAATNAELDRLAQLAPQWDLPVAWQAERLRKQNPDNAIVFLKKELDRRPYAGLELKMAYPRLLVGAKRFVEARQAFETLLAQYPQQPDLMYGAGLLAFQLNDLDVARVELTAALNAGYPDADFLRYSLGQIAENQHDSEAAQKWYQQVAPGAQYLPSQVRLASIESQNGHLDAALARMAKLGSNDEERLQLVLIQSEMAREAKRYDRANTVLIQALKKFPHDPQLLYEHALILDQLNQPAGAEHELRQLLKLRPNDDQALNALGYVLASRTTRYQEAYELIGKALKQSPDNPMILDSMGWVLYKLGRQPEALQYLQKAYAALPDQEIAAHYGEVLWKMGRQSDARALWDKALQTTADHPQLDETMHRLLAQ
jgi:tetratricopeptide (TPR) repeat protein